MYIVKYERYGIPGEHRFGTLKEAMDSSAGDIEFNMAYPIEIINEDTRKVEKTRKQIVDYCHKKYNELYEENKKQKNR